jgi:hypothetical protein
VGGNVALVLVICGGCIPRCAGCDKEQTTLSAGVVSKLEYYRCYRRGMVKFAFC